MITITKGARFCLGQPVILVEKTQFYQVLIEQINFSW